MSLKKMTLILIIFSIGLYIAFYSFKKVFTPHAFIIRPDSLYNPLYIKNLEEKLTHLPLTSAWKDIYKFIQNNIPLNSCSFHLYANGNLTIYLKAPQPLAYIKLLSSNLFAVLIDNGSLQPSSLYKKEAVTNLPLIIIEDPFYQIGLPVPELFSFFKKIPLSFFKNYYIFWHNKTDIKLKHLTEQFLITVTTQMIFDTIFDKKIAYAFKQAEEKKLLSNKRHLYWNSDVRFKNQLILSPQKGGEKYEIKNYIP